MTRMESRRPLQRIVALCLMALLVCMFNALAACGGGGSNKHKNPVPVLTSVSPASAPAGGAAFTLTVNGSGFVSGSVVQWNGVARTTTYVGSTQLTAAIPATDLAGAGTAQVTVLNPTPGGGVSSALTFTIQALAPVPVISTFAPAGVAAGSPAFDLYVTGTGFVQGAVVQWNGTDRITTFISPTQVKAAILAADVSSPASIPVAVKNPAPGGGTSNTLDFVISRSVVSNVPVTVTVAPDGSPPNGPSVNGGLDYSGRYAIFASKASNLVPGDTNDAWDIFVRDTCTDNWVGPVPGCVPTTTRISVAPDGSQSNGDSGSTAASPDRSLAVSLDGRYTVFVSSANNLVAGDTNGVDDVFVTNTCIGSVGACVPKTVRVSLRADGSQSSLPAKSPAVGEAPDYVAFVSADSNMVAGDGNGTADVFLRDVCYTGASGCTPGTRRISVAPSGGDVDGASDTPAFTGRYVAFTSSAANLVSGDTNGGADVFMRDTCIGAPAGCTPSTERISVGNDGGQADGASSDPVLGLPMSGMDGYDYHGRFVVFVSSAANLVTGDTNDVADVFMRDTCRGRTSCVPSTKRISLTSNGQQIVGQASMQPGHMRWDGEVVLFVTAANGVVPQDVNGLADIYSRRVCHGGVACVEHTTLMSVGSGGTLGNAASDAPRGNHDAWTGPDYVTFSSRATNFLTGSVPTPYYGSIFKTRAQ